ncbi:glycosyltransferase family 2 protein [Streptacidiphilus jiangxiensis]|uniref:4,4'-diaponeurosporenoate glycosyltransferase n=1 Tax=Streptacidiphilus jiangxiensis TaxID=235985 RepID=A0A1H7WJ17_STRJI|nr:glycosyltransferase [Streptacidiphilus jiangxiensis]SEM21115.1 Glycosyltransferase involved in cell wall bisynthesis [Streptacidiphilus jiangxiensis]
MNSPTATGETDRPHVSVVVPAFNEACFLPRCLGSLHHSALRLADIGGAVSCEIVVADNASTDATAETARAFGARVVQVPRRGVARARNAGARAARGDLLVFVDADYRVPLGFLTGITARFGAEPTLTAAGVRVELEPAEIDPLTRLCAHGALRLLTRVKRMSFGVLAVRAGYFASVGGYREDLYAYEDVAFLEQLRADARRGRARWAQLDGITVHASPRGFHRGGMLSTYALMAVSRRARTDLTRCGYWYERR